ncbi:hypothetical protein [Maribacter sp. R77961]|uniref:hypothetical protein n=1 Tax=Maribacter sp. R77961 TaxID=3093871 RepID=UPI0037CB7756
MIHHKKSKKIDDNHNYSQLLSIPENVSMCGAKERMLDYGLLVKLSRLVSKK